jgi:iron(III) transport system permease protein
VGGDVTSATQERGVLAIAALVVGAAALLPLLVLAGAAAATVSAPPPAAAWIQFLRSAGIAAAVAVTATAAGVPLGVLFARARFAGRGAAALLHAFPLFLPPLLPALGWWYLLGAQGTTALVLILAATLTPVVTALTALGILGVDPALEDAARIVAGPGRVIAAVLLPLAWPSIAVGAGLVFALALSEVGVPMLLMVRTYPATVLARLGGVAYAPGEAFALALPLGAVGVLLLALELRLARRIALVPMRRDRPPLDLGRRAWIAPAAGAGAAALGLAPLVSLVARAGPAGLAAAPDWVGTSVVNGLASGLAAAAVIAAVGLVVGHAWARRRRVARILDAVAVLAFLTPAAALGVGLIAVWNHGPTAIVYQSLGIVVVGSVARYGLIGIRVVGSAVAAAAPHLEDAAALAGAGYLRRLGGIVAPIHRRAIGAAFLLALVFCLRDLETAVLYYPPGGETLPVRIFTLEANGPPAVVAGLATVHVLVTAVVVGTGVGLLRRRP